MIFPNKKLFWAQQKCSISNSQKGFCCEFENRCEKNSTKVTGENFEKSQIHHAEPWFEHFCNDFGDFVVKSIGISGFSTIFDWLVLEAQRELDNVFGHFWYLLILKRSFLAIVAVPGDSRVPNLDVEDSRIWQNLICTTLLLVIISDQLNRIITQILRFGGPWDN